MRRQFFLTHQVPMGKRWKMNLSTQVIIIYSKCNLFSPLYGWTFAHLVVSYKTSSKFDNTYKLLYLTIYSYSVTCRKPKLSGTKFCVRSRQMFSLYSLHLQRFSTMGLYLKFNINLIYRIQVYTQLGADRFHCTIFLVSILTVPSET